MPFITDAQAEAETPVLPPTPVPTPALAEKPAPGMLDVAAAAFRQSNIISSVYGKWAAGGYTQHPAVPGYSPFDGDASEINGYEPHKFVDSESPEQTQQIKNNIDNEASDKETTDRGGAWGFATALAGGATDPITLSLMFIPGLGELAGASRAAKIAGVIGTNVLAGEAQAAALAANSEMTNYTDGMIPRVGVNALLAGVLGTLATRIPKAEMGPLADRTNANLAPESSTAGAAAVHTTTLEDESIARGGKFIANTVGKLSPSTRVFSDSKVVESRVLAQQLVDPGFMLEKNLKGVATQSSVEMRVNQQENVRNSQLFNKRDQEFADYKANGGGLTGPQFDAEIANAMRENDAHEIPQVRNVAAYVRPIFQADRKFLADQGLMKEGEGVTGAPSYFPRVYDQPMVMAHQTDLEDRLYDHFKSTPKTEPVKGPDIPAAPVTKGMKQAQQNSTFKYEDNAGAYGRLTGFPQKKGTPVEKLFSNFADTKSTPEQQATFRSEMFKRANAEPKSFEKEEVATHEEDFGGGFKARIDAAKGGNTRLQILKGSETVGAARMHRGMIDSIATTESGRGNGLGAKMLSYLDRNKIANIDEVPDRSPGFVKAQKEAIVNRATDTHTPTGSPQGPRQPIYREPAEISDSVQAMIEHIQGMTRGTADIGVGVSKPALLRSRADVPDSILKPYLSHDFQHVMTSYNHSVLPLIEMHRTFGSTDLARELADVTAAYRVKREGAQSDAEKAELSNQQNADLKNLTLLRDRVLNQSGPSGNTSLKLVKAAQVVRSFNYLRMLGGQTLSAIPDIGRLVTRYGLVNTAHRLTQFLTGMDQGLSKIDAQRMGTALDVVLHTRMHTLDGIGDEMAGSSLANSLHNATSRFTKVTGIAHWDAMMRVLSSQLEQDAMYRAITKEGLSAFERAKLAAHGIGDKELSAIREQWMTHGSDESGLNRARTDLWTDKKAAGLVEQAVQRAGSTNAFFVGKGDLPGFANSQLGKMIVQFKAFAISSVNRLAIPLAQGLAHGDVMAANGLTSMLALGALTYYVKEVAAGRKPDLSMHALIPNAVQRSGILTYIPDLYDPVAGTLHLPRFAKFHDLDPLETFGGPSAGTVASLMDTVRRMTKGNVSAMDLHKLRQLIPYQNLFYFNRLINMVEGKTADALNLKDATGKPALDYLNPMKDEDPGNRTDKQHLFGIEAIPNAF